ncbi:MAG TPA: TlpA disulfide reductase family protein [Ktedonobacterales bacterium]|nr:TlpA disulfide reductase family protein [Ktedonobacterales bacterium]
MARPQDAAGGARPRWLPLRAGAGRRQTVVRVAAAGVAVATVGILLWALLTPAPGTAGTGGKPLPTAPTVGHYAPEVTLLDLRDGQVKLSSLRGKVVVLNFWYAACEPCVTEMPALQRVYEQEAARGLVVVGIDTSDDARTASDFIHRLGVTYPIWRDLGERAVVTYQVVDTPTSFIIDRNGVIRYKQVGPFDQATVTRVTTALLASK